MQHLQTFKFNNQLVKVQNNGNQIWFCGADVARAIGYKNPAEAIADNVSPEHSCQLYLGKKGRKPIFISEPGLYELIMRSNLPTAVPFQKWVYSQVLPSIRKTGTYTGQMPLSESGVLMANLPALIARENFAPTPRVFKVRDIVMVNYGTDDRRKAIVLDFLGCYLYVKFLNTDETDFVVASKILKAEAN